MLPIVASLMLAKIEKIHFFSSPFQLRCTDAVRKYQKRSYTKILLHIMNILLRCLWKYYIFTSMQTRKTLWVRPHIFSLLMVSNLYIYRIFDVISETERDQYSFIIVEFYGNHYYKIIISYYNHLIWILVHSLLDVYELEKFYFCLLSLRIL